MENNKAVNKVRSAAKAIRTANLDASALLAIDRLIAACDIVEAEAAQYTKIGYPDQVRDIDTSDIASELRRAFGAELGIDLLGAQQFVDDVLYAVDHPGEL